MGRSPSAAAGAAAPSALQLHALTRLCHALETARELTAPPWEFACQLPDLRADGVTDTDLRWLLASGDLGVCGDGGISLDRHCQQTDLQQARPTGAGPRETGHGGARRRRGWFVI